MRNTFVKFFANHHHRRRAAAREALDKVDGELAIRRRLRTMRVRVETQFRAKIMMQFIRAAERATQRAANLDRVFSLRLLPEHWIKRQDFKNVEPGKLDPAKMPLTQKVALVPWEVVEI